MTESVRQLSERRRYEGGAGPLPEHMAAALALPVVNMNGTPMAHFMEAYCDALEALRRAETAVMATGPNGRDYCGNDPLWRQAVAQHSRRLVAIKHVIDELQFVAENTRKQRD